MVKCEYDNGFMKIEVNGTAAAIEEQLNMLNERILGVLSETSQDEVVSISGTFDLED